MASSVNRGAPAEKHTFGVNIHQIKKQRKKHILQTRWCECVSRWDSTGHHVYPERCSTYHTMHNAIDVLVYGLLAGFTVEVHKKCVVLVCWAIRECRVYRGRSNITACVCLCVRLTETLITSCWACGAYVTHFIVLSRTQYLNRSTAHMSSLPISQTLYLQLP